MYIKSFIVQNFKTLKEFSIDFEQGYNIIIGKNNTGKSNILKFLDKLFTDGCEFDQTDITTINNTERATPKFEIDTSVNTYEKRKTTYYLNGKNSQVNFTDFKTNLNKIKTFILIFKKNIMN